MNNQEFSERIAPLITDFIVHHSMESTAEDHDEWHYESEEKFNIIYDLTGEFLGFPSLADTLENTMETIFDEDSANQFRVKEHQRAMTIFQFISELICIFQSSFLQNLDIPVDEKLRLLALAAVNKEDMVINADLNLLKLKDIKFVPISEK